MGLVGSAILPPGDVLGDVVVVVVIGFLMLLKRGRVDFGRDVATAPRALGTAGAFTRRAESGL